MRKTHVLKIWPEFYEAVEKGHKTFEVRVNDRGFQCGEFVTLNKWIPDKLHIAGGRFTGEGLCFKIGYVYPVDENRVVFSLKPMDWDETT